MPEKGTALDMIKCIAIRHCLTDQIQTFKFELRQLAAVRQDLDREYEESITTTARSSQPRFSSNSVP